MITFNDKFRLDPDVCCSDKSLTHRALIAASIADGVSRLHRVTLSRDVLCTLNALRSAVANIDIVDRDEYDRATVVVEPRAPARKCVTVDCGNSGTTARLLAGLFCGIGVEARFTGDDSLSRRPMTRVIEPLRCLGADIAPQEGYLFVTHGGALHGATLHAEVPSAQVKSAVILAGLFAEGETRYIEQVPTRDHTERMLHALGADVVTDGNAVTVRRSRPSCFELTLPNDPSAVAYSVALALLTGQRACFRDVLLNERRMGFYRVLQHSGAEIHYGNVRTLPGERVGDITVERSVLHEICACEQDVCDAIDEIPLLASIALFVKGRHTFRGVGELTHKESNRIEAIKHIAETCGQRCIQDGDELTVISDGVVPRGRTFKSFGDHRIAMCETVLSVAVGGGCVDSAPYAISHPMFLKSLGIEPLRFGLIGENVSDSLSPRLHAALALNAGVCCSYEAVSLPSDTSDAELSEAIRAFDGVNITMPFKRRVGALFGQGESVNTLFDGDKCTSTDGYGVVQALRAHGIAFAGQPLWIVGAGGAAEAAIAELLKYDCKLSVLNRTAAHAAALAHKYALTEVRDPVGVLSFVPECAFEQSLVLPDSCRFVLIADYKGLSGLRIQAERRGLAVIEGREMLFHQGAASFALWTGTPIQTDYELFAEEK